MTRLPAGWERRIAFAAQLLGAAAVIVLMVQVSLNGVLRRLVGVQIPFTLEMTQWWYMPVIAGTGIAIAAVYGEHFYVDLVFERLSPAGRRLLAAFAVVVALVLTAAITWFSFLQAVKEAEIGRYEPVTGLLVWPLYFLIPLAFAAYSAVLVANLVRLIVGRDLRELADPHAADHATEPESSTEPTS